MSRAVSLVALLSLAATVCAAQNDPELIRPGDARVDASHLVFHTDSFMLSPEPGTALLLQIATLRGSSAATPSVLRVERIMVPGGEVFSTDSFAASVPRLAPLEDVEVTPEESRQLRFSGDSVTGWRKLANGRKPVLQRLDGTRFYMNTTDLLLGSLPLAEGAEFHLAMWDPARVAGYTLVARVRSLEMVETVEGGRCQGWRVEVVESGEPSVYWMEASSRTLLRFRSGNLEIRGLRHPACPATQPVQTAMN